MKPFCFQSHIHKNIIFSPPKEIKLFVVLVDMVQLLEVAMIFVSEIKVATNCQVNLNFLQIQQLVRLSTLASGQERGEAS